MHREIFLPLEVDFADDKDVAKIARYGKDARAVRDLLVQMWCYCKGEKSDGHVPLEQVGKLVYPDPPKVGKRDADRLVDIGLAEHTPDGYYFPGFLKRNKSRAEIEAESARKSEAGRMGGIRSGAVRRGEADAKHVASGSLNSEDRGQRTEDRDQQVDQVRGVTSPTATRGFATKPPRCNTHQNQDEDPGPCRGCMRARQAAEQAQAEATVRTQAAAIGARLACTRCDPDGWALDTDGLPTARKCTHRSNA